MIAFSIFLMPARTWVLYKKIINRIKTKYFAKQGDVYYIFEVKMLPQPAILPWG